MNKTHRGSRLALAVWLIAGTSLLLAGPGDARLADAVMKGDRDVVRTLIQQKTDVNAAQVDGMTALHWAVRQNDVEMVQSLLKAGAKADSATRYGVTPIYIASLNGNAAMIDVLLRAGVDANSANPGGETALMTAARTGSMDAVRLLIERGANVNVKEGTRGQTALMWAVLENHPDVARLLIEKGADVNAQTQVVIPDGVNPEPTATSGNIGANGPGFYRSRAVPAPSGAMSPLLFAAREGNLSMARLLVDSKANLDLPSANGSTPIVVAITNNHIQLAMFLLEKGANPNTADKFWKRTPLYAAVEMRNMDFTRESPPPVPDVADPMDLIKALLARGANPNAPVNTTPVRGFMQGSANWVNFDGQTAFIRAALAGDVTLMRLLLQNGADPNIKTNEGSSALMAAAGVNFQYQDLPGTLALVRWHALSSSQDRRRMYTSVLRIRRKVKSLTDDPDLRALNRKEFIKEQESLTFETILHGPLKDYLREMLRASWNSRTKKHALKWFACACAAPLVPFAGPMVRCRPGFPDSQGPGRPHPAGATGRPHGRR